MEYPNRVKDTTTTTGTGNITLAGTPPSTYTALGDKVAVGKKFPYGLFHKTLNEWEIGVGTVLTATTFSRAPTDSSNSGALVNFSAGTKDMLCVVAGDDLKRVQRTSQIPFAAAIPLDTPGSSFMTPAAVSGALTFTAVAGAVQGALVYLRLTADGVNLPSFAAFKEWGGSSGYDNRNGIVNQLQFFYDGSDLFYTASQAVGAVAVAAPDTLAPALSSPTGSGTGTTTATGSVTTANDANGTLYYLFSTSSTATATAVKAGSTQAITSTGVKTVTASGLIASTTYYVHFLHRDAAGNDSSVVSSASFQTSAAGDTQAPSLSSATATKTGSTTATGNVTTVNDANGTLYYMASVNATETATTVKAGASQAVTATGVQTVSFTGLPAATTLYAHYLHRDAAGNDSAVANTASSFTTDAASGGSSFLRLTTLSKTVETGTGPYTYTTSASSGNFDQNGGVSTQVRPVSTNASACAINTENKDLIFGVTNASNAAFASMDYCLFTGAGTGSAYIPITGGSIGSATAVTRATGDIMRLSFVGTTLVAEVARTATPTTWIPVYTWTGVSTASRKFAVNMQFDGVFQTSTAVGLV